MQKRATTIFYYNIYLFFWAGRRGNRQEVMDNWKQLLGENLIIVDRHPEVSQVIAQTVLKQKGNTVTNKTETKNSEDEIIL